MTTIVTKDMINEMIMRNNSFSQHFIGRALVVLFQRQTNEEKQVARTKLTNGVGFTQADARSGTITAKYYLKHNKLEDWQIERWRKPNRLAKYHAQLNDAAIAKQRGNI